MNDIEVLNKMANGELEDRFKFCFEDEVYTYTKNDDAIRDSDFNKLGQRRAIENYLNEEVLLFKDNNQEENKEIEELSHKGYLELKEGYYDLEDILNGIRTDLERHQDKINEVVQVINKEREEK